MRIDIVTVFHSETNYRMYLNLIQQISRYEVKGGWRMIGVDNRIENRGFAKGCNYGAFDPVADAPVIGFLNPDCIITAAFMDQVYEAFRANQSVVIAGNRFGKEQRELKIWGVREWVCGAVCFVRRDWFTEQGGFDEQFVWGWEETDLIRRAQVQGKRVANLDLPIEHASPDVDTAADTAYKRKWFAEGGERFYAKWPANG